MALCFVQERCTTVPVVALWGYDRDGHATGSTARGFFRVAARINQTFPGVPNDYSVEKSEGKVVMESGSLRSRWNMITALCAGEKERPFGLQPRLCLALLLVGCGCLSTPVSRRARRNLDGNGRSPNESDLP